MRKILVATFIGIALLQSSAQTQIGFRLPKDVNRVDIPFEEINNLVVVPIIVNEFLRLNFIVDTGVENTILTEPAFVGALGIDLVRIVTISGVGIEDSVRAYVTSPVDFSLPGGISGKNMGMLVLEDDFLRLSENMGKDIHGIIGYDLFKHFVVEFNYDTKLMRVYPKDRFKVKRKMRTLPLEIYQNKPYVTTWIRNGNKEIPARLLVDSGASHAVLLDPDQNNIAMPEKTMETKLGTGLGGVIYGDLARLEALKLADFSFNNVLISIPHSDAYSNLIKRGSRQGTIGSEILTRLNPVFDYSNKELHISRSKQFTESFETDMSGLNLIATGPFLDTLKVDYVRKDSPADQAGILPGDVILSISSHHLGNNSFGYIQAVLKDRPNRKLRLRVLREGEKFRRIIKLKRQI